ncbi:hypothetical protein [Adlercreutzia sp. ZJ242]|uniref:hypothetical protein n=1 Tax=Adlercreutzia sp. ZJ242 TaxID=2709409 RepID=UPI0013EB7291|nr:hypothetical protein [Adlercreutzia sp. ZJ242]
MPRVDAYSKFERTIESFWDGRGLCNASRRYWDEQKRPKVEISLLEELLSRSMADGDTSRSGSLARALDMWIAEELRAAGFDENAVWPRLHAPRVLDPSVFRFINAMSPSVAELCCRDLPRFAGANANVLGAAYCKQVDVGLSSWMTGPEILISTKTMSSSFGKNLANRFEEAYGDAKNLKGRHPLCTLGFFFLVNASIAEEKNTFAKAVSMLEKLQAESDAYDVTCLLLVDMDDSKVTVSRENDKVPDMLSVENFFKKIIELTLLRASPESHERAKAKVVGS